MNCLLLAILAALSCTVPALAQPPPEFAPDAKAFAPSQNPDVLADVPQALEDLPRVAATLERTVAGDLVVAVVRLAGRRPGYALVVHRLRDRRTVRLWTLTQVAQRNPTVEARSRKVAHAFIDANNRGDADAFLALFDPQAKNFRTSGDPDRLGDRPSRTVVDAASREKAYRTMFGARRQAQVTAQAVLALGDLVVSHDLARLPNGRLSDGLSVYRLRNGRITHDWYIYDRLRE